MGLLDDLAYDAGLNCVSDLTDCQHALKVYLAIMLISIWGYGVKEWNYTVSYLKVKSSFSLSAARARSFLARYMVAIAGATICLNVLTVKKKMSPRREMFYTCGLFGRYL